jgi:radical SAM superfamily enzyme YgiQ (UPF0313 family)
MKKVQLIHCPGKPTGMTDAENDCYIPLNLLSIATYLQLHGHEVEILDGQLLTIDEIILRLGADIIGLDLRHDSLKSFDLLSKAAKNKGAITIVGGHLATHLAREILQQNPFIDFVCRLGGEEALLALCKNRLHPNLAYRNPETGIYAPSWRDLKPVNLAKMPIPDRSISGVDIEEHIRLFQTDMGKSDLKLPYNQVTNTYFSRGCPYRAAGQGCSFCSRADMIMSCRTAKQIWKEIYYLVSQYGIRCPVDFSDTAITWIYRLARYVEKHGRPWKYLRIYAAVNEIARPGTIEVLKKLGVITVLLGIESADEEVLRLNVAPQKVHTPERVLSVTRVLAKAGIMIAPAFVFGMKGENERSLEKTLELNRAIQAIDNTEITYGNGLTPFPGARSWDDLMQIPGMRERHGNTYHLDTKKLENDYAEHFTTVPWSRQQEARRELARDSAVTSFEFVPPCE